MILYVFLLWLCAMGLVLGVELFLLSLAGPSRHISAPVIPLSGPDPLQVAYAGQVGSMLFLVLVLGLVLGYLLESRLRPVRQLYLALQSHYPVWYQRWPALYRELWLALGVGLLLQWPLVLLLFSMRFWPLSAFSVAMAAGILMPVAWRLRATLSDDRPEQAPRALIHHVAPRYSLPVALWVGQAYLRVLLPVFGLFCGLALPLSLGYLTLSLTETSLVLGALCVGTLWGWRVNPESHLSFESVRANFLQLSALTLLASAFLLFGLGSGNLYLMVWLGAFSGFLAGVY